MGTGYTRNDTSNNIANGNVIDADDLDGEFNAIESAFDSSTGHTHDGTSAEGGVISVTGPNQEYLSDATALYPKTDDTYDLGKTGSEWKDLYIDGVANIDSLVADTADINGGTIDGTTIGGTSAGAITGTTITGTSLVGPLTGDVTGDLTGNVTSTGTSSFATVTVSGTSSFATVTVSGTVDGRDLSVDGAKLDGIEANATADQTAAEIKTAYESNANTNTFTDADESKLDGIEANATADQTAAEIKTAYESNANTNAFTDSEQTKLSGIEANATADQTAAEIKTAYESNANTNAFTDADESKLDGIEASADVTDTANVTAAGALMDSELTDITAVKALDQGVATTDSPTFAEATITGDLTVDTDTLFVDASSNSVGIGTSSPTQRLEVNSGVGNIAAQFVSTDSGVFVNFQDDSSIADVLVGASGDAIIFRNNDTERMRINSSGNVGIGTSAPAHQFEVENSGGSAIIAATSSTTGTSQLRLGDTDNTGAGRVDYDNSDNTMSLVTGGTERVSVSSSGITVDGTVDATGWSGGTQSEATWEAGTSTTESIVSPAKVKAAIEELSYLPVGVNQTWQSVTRTANTVYQAPSDRAIMVSKYDSFGAAVQVSSVSSSGPWVTIGTLGSPGAFAVSITFTVPAGHWYRFSGSLQTTTAAELR